MQLMTCSNITKWVSRRNFTSDNGAVFMFSVVQFITRREINPHIHTHTHAAEQETDAVSQQRPYEQFNHSENYNPQLHLRNMQSLSVKRVPAL